ncbi:hypothetical protein VNI00_016142 [Paramarasmius palmivorus]|uniref:Uncharacterized protein n=1 Tax=Paramarasmius palmivorus TaxID=297713 RepID=A0AAW0BDY1_9AGAR
MNLERLLMSVSGIVFAFLFVFYVSAFALVTPSDAEVDQVNNIAANWTWSEGDPTKVLISLFVNSVPDVCAFGKSNPVDIKGIQQDIQGAAEINGRKNGTILYQAEKIGEYILCAYEDITPSGGKLNLTTIANSSVFSVARLPTVQTTTLFAVTSLNPTASASRPPNEIDTGRKSSQMLSAGIIAGIVVGAVSLAAFIFTISILFRRIRRSNRGNRQDVPAETIISPYSHLVPSQTPPPKSHGSPHVGKRDTIPTSVRAANQVDEAQGEHQRERRVMYHNDSGWRPPSQSDAGISSVLEMPPSYRSAL